MKTVNRAGQKLKFYKKFSVSIQYLLDEEERSQEDYQFNETTMK
jgi:hypothetical protein